MDNRCWLLSILIVAFLLQVGGGWSLKSAAESGFKSDIALFLAVDPPPGWEPPVDDTDDESDDDDDEPMEETKLDFTGEDLKSCNQPCVNTFSKGKGFKILSKKVMDLDVPSDPSTDPQKDDIHLPTDEALEDASQDLESFEPVPGTEKPARSVPRDVRKALRDFKKAFFGLEERTEGTCTIAKEDENKTVTRQMSWFDETKKSEVTYKKLCRCDDVAGAQRTPLGEKKETVPLSMDFWAEEGVAYVKPGTTSEEPSLNDLETPGGRPVTLGTNEKLGEKGMAMGKRFVTIMRRKRVTYTVELTSEESQETGICTTHYEEPTIWLDPSQSETDKKDTDSFEKGVTGNDGFVSTSTPWSSDEWTAVAKQGIQDQETGLPLEGTLIVIPKESDKGQTPYHFDATASQPFQAGDTLVIKAPCHERKTYVIGQDSMPSSLTLGLQPLVFVVNRTDQTAVENIITDLAKAGITVDDESIEVSHQGLYDQIIIRRYEQDKATPANICPKLPRCTLSKDSQGWYEPRESRHGEGNR